MKIIDIMDRLFMIAAYAVIIISVGALVLYTYAGIIYGLLKIGGYDVPNPAD